MSTIPVARIWEDADGVSHFADDFVALDAAGDIGSLSRRFAASGLVFRQTPGTYNFDWHCAPRRQFICNLDADVEITVGDGETRVLAAGTVFFVEDIRGRGHISRAVGGRARTSIFIAVEDHEYRRADAGGDAVAASRSA